MLKQLKLIACLIISFCASNAMAADCVSPISGTVNVTSQSSCDLGGSGLTINSDGTLNASIYSLTDSATNSFIINNGTVNLNGAYALEIDSSTLSELTNNNILNLTNSYSIRVKAGGAITHFNNTSTINMSTDYPIFIDGGAITQFTNSGTIQARCSGTIHPFMAYH